jgi:hypothetical protein
VVSPKGDWYLVFWIQGHFKVFGPCVKGAVSEAFFGEAPDLARATQMAETWVKDL